MRRILIAGLGLLTGIGLASSGIPAAGAGVPRCFGQRATIVGTARGDRMRGTPGSDVIVGLGGFDDIKGRGGDDLICSGGGFDEIIGGAGADRLAGEGRSDGLFGGTGDDLLDGGTGEDNLVGGPGADTVIGGTGDDQMESGPGDDALDGGAGEDFMNFEAAPGPIAVDLSAGTATGDGSDVLEAVEDLLGSAFDDTVAGNEEPNILIGAEGDDVVSGGQGDDELWDFETADTDRFDGGEGQDLLSYLFAESPIHADLTAGTATGAGSDVLLSIENVFGGLGDDTILGNAGPNLLFGGFGGADALSAADGDDLLVGDGAFCGFLPCDPEEGVFDDVLDGGGGVDIVDYSSAAGPIELNLAAGTATGEGADTLSTIENVLGSDFDDTLIGNAMPNELFGGIGRDDLSGAEGDDTLDGGMGNDSLDGGPGNDTCTGGETIANCEAYAQARRGWPRTIPQAVVKTTGALLVEVCREPAREHCRNRDTPRSPPAMRNRLVERP